MNADKIQADILSLLPDNPKGPNSTSAAVTNDLAKENANKIANSRAAAEIARAKHAEKQKLEAFKARAKAKELAGIPEELTAAQHERIKEQEAKIEVLEAIEEQTMGLQDVVRKNLTPSQLKTVSQIGGATRPEVLKLLASLNINLNLQLTKTDTANLLACLLTCNESQLNTLLKNQKIPVAIKIVIKRLIDDLKLGNMDTLERLWDRVFGKTAMTLDLPGEKTVNGIIPNTPVSREAYLILRDTYLG